MKFIFILTIILLSISPIHAQVKGNVGNRSANGKGNIQYYKKSKLLFSDNFNTKKDWVFEIFNNNKSKVITNNKKLIIDADGGATVWLNKKLSGNILITYKRKVIIGGDDNDRLSDFNQFWMATDPMNKNLFTRTGIFSQYDSLRLYYVGFGGNGNTSTRFRKYTGTGDRALLKEFTDTAHLLQPNKTYLIKIIVYNGQTKFFVNDKEFFSFHDPNPLQEGYFGFRLVKSRQEISDLKIYRLK